MSALNAMPAMLLLLRGCNHCYFAAFLGIHDLSEHIDHTHSHADARVPGLFIVWTNLSDPLMLIRLATLFELRLVVCCKYKVWHFGSVALPYPLVLLTGTLALTFLGLK